MFYSTFNIQIGIWYPYCQESLIKAHLSYYNEQHIIIGSHSGGTSIRNNSSESSHCTILVWVVDENENMIVYFLYIYMYNVILMIIDMCILYKFHNINFLHSLNSLVLD